MDDRLESVRTAATAFRQAIESCKRDLGIVFAQFPHGSCGDTAELLARYLSMKKLGGFTYVWGQKGCQDDDTFHTHAWLRRGGVIIDITADQFGGQPPVIVTTDSTWHDSFEIMGQRSSDFDGRTEDMANRLAQIFARIVSRIPEGKGT